MTELMSKQDWMALSPHEMKHEVTRQHKAAQHLHDEYVAKLRADLTKAKRRLSSPVLTLIKGE